MTTDKAPPGNGPHMAKLRGGNVVTVQRYDANCKWVCTRTKRAVQPIAWVRAGKDGQ